MDGLSTRDGRKIIGIARLNAYMEEIFDNEELLHGICVRGELGDFSLNRKTLFFTLKEANDKLRCVFFDYNGTPLSEGRVLIARGTPVYSGKFGALRFNVSEIRAEGRGELYERFLALKERLAADGLFAAANKIPVPSGARKICVVTSDRGAAVRDIISTARRRDPAVDLKIYPVRVQGAGASDEVADAVRVVDALSGADVIIVARGGGSGEDLEAFNSEAVARAVAACRTPVVSAVGHETDVTLCDLAADLRVATPTAAAVAVTAEARNLRETLSFTAAYIARLAANSLSARASRVQNFCGTLSYLCADLFHYKSAEIASRARSLGAAADDVFRDRETELIRLKDALARGNPLSLLERGYAKVLKDGGAARIGGAGGLKRGDGVDIILRGGTARATVTGVEINDNGKRRLNNG